MQEIHKVKGLKLLITISILNVMLLAGYEYWLRYPAKNPESAVVKYCNAKSLKNS